MMTISFTVFGLIFTILAAITATAIASLLLDHWDVIWLEDPWDGVCFFIAVFGIIAVLIMGMFSKCNFDKYTETEYDIEQMIVDIEAEGYEVQEKFDNVKEPTLNIYTSLISGKKKYILYTPKESETDKYRRSNDE